MTENPTIEKRRIPDERADSIRRAFAKAEGREADEPISYDADTIDEIREKAPSVDFPDATDCITFSVKGDK